MANTWNQHTIGQPLAPTIGDAVPQRGNRFTKMVAVLLLRLTGWRIVGEVPNVPKLIVIGAPHTSYWDFWLAMMTIFALGVRIEIMGMDKLFKHRPLAAFFSWAGVFPVVRESSNGMVDAVVERINGRNQMFLGLSPEGTRKKVDNWRTGFYHIAQKTSLDILPVRLDFGQKNVLIYPPFTPTGQIDKDMQQLKSYYQGAVGKHAEKF